MKFKSILVLLFAAVLAVSNCNNKKDTSARDSLLFTFLAGMAGTGSNGGSCAICSGAACPSGYTNSQVTLCYYTVGPMPAGFNFSANCASNSGTYNATKDCAAHGYDLTKCKNDAANTFGGYSVKCNTK